jgi:hypothetical protein
MDRIKALRILRTGYLICMWVSLYVADFLASCRPLRTFSVYGRSAGIIILCIAAIFACQRALRLEFKLRSETKAQITDENTAINSWHKCIDYLLCMSCCWFAADLIGPHGPPWTLLTCIRLTGALLLLIAAILFAQLGFKLLNELQEEKNARIEAENTLISLGLSGNSVGFGMQDEKHEY